MSSKPNKKLFFVLAEKAHEPVSEVIPFYVLIYADNIGHAKFIFKSVRGYRRQGSKKFSEIASEKINSVWLKIGFNNQTRLMESGYLKLVEPID